MLNLLKIIKIQKEIKDRERGRKCGFSLSGSMFFCISGRICGFDCNGEEHSRVPKGNGVKHLTETPFEERMGNFGICLACAVAVIYLVGNDVTGAGVADDVALVPTIALLWDSASKAFG